MHRKAMKRSGNPLQLRKGAWDSQEDNLLRKCIDKYGEGKWHLVPKRSGLNRCRKSCRLRWFNYLRPTIKRGEFSEAEVDLMMRLHRLLGNRWSLIAGRLPGRTGNDVKNFWNTSLRAKLTPAEVEKKVSTVKGEELSQTKDDNNTKTSSAKSDHVVITPLPRTLSKGTTVSIKYSPPCPQEIMYNNGNNMTLLSQKPPATLPLDYDSIKWWNTLLGEERGIDGQEEEPGEEVEEWLDLDAQRGLIWNTNESFVPATEAVDLLKEDSQTNGWSDDIWDFLNDDYN